MKSPGDLRVSARERKIRDQPVQLDVVQGSAAWFEARRGIPTASCFKRILTASGRRSASAPQYLQELACEYHNGRGRQPESSPWMARGIELEPEARSVYEARTGAAVTETGLVYLNHQRLVAASPDGLVGAEGLLEIKCPMEHTHRDYLRSSQLPSPHVPQVQGQLWITGRRWCDFFSYHPDYETRLIRVFRDEAYIGKLRAAVTAFVDDLLAARRGGWPCG